MAAVAAEMENQSGREWRPLVDTAVAVQLTYSSPRAWLNYRRRVDYYDEGSLIWLEADTVIRNLTQGKKSLDDFCKLFHGGQSGPPEVVPYTFDQVVAALNQVAPNDWRTFLNTRLLGHGPGAPLGGIENSGCVTPLSPSPSINSKIGLSLAA